MQKEGHLRLLIAILYILEDIFLINLLFFIMFHYFHMAFDDNYKIVFILINLGYLFSFAIIRVDFNDVKQLHIPHLSRRNIYKLIITILILVTSLFFLKISDDISRFFIGLYFSILFFILTFAQWVTRKFLTFTIKRTISKGVIIGAGQIGELVFAEMLRNVYNNVVILGFFDDNPEKNKGDVIGSIEDAKEFILKHDVSYIFCTLSVSAEKKIVDLIKFAESHVINFHIVPSIGYYYSGPQPIVQYLGKLPVFVLRNIPLSYIHKAFIKRGFDILFSLLVIVILFPLIFPIIALLIKLSSPGPVFFQQKRTGKKGKEFTCFKFRTMRVSVDAHIRQATADDARKTKIGNFLRKTSLDELPQFFNVLVGNMSIVGPRPHMLAHTYEYSPIVDKYMVRHFVKPGITGLAQVRGYRGETKDNELMEKRIISDIYYVENWSFGMDLLIMLKTVIMILKGDEKAY